MRLLLSRLLLEDSVGGDRLPVFLRVKVRRSVVYMIRVLSSSKVIVKIFEVIVQRLVHFVLLALV